jgi:hypothetical protein
MIATRYTIINTSFHKLIECKIFYACNKITHATIGIKYEIKTKLTVVNKKSIAIKLNYSYHAIYTYNWFYKTLLIR